MDIVRRRWLFFLISAIFIVPGIISMLIPPHFNLGIEFTGGSALTVEFQTPVAEQQLRDALIPLGHGAAVIQRLGEDTVFIRTAELSETGVERDEILAALGQVAPVVSSQFDSVSPVVAAETVRNAAIAVVVASLVILFYISWAFRRVPNSFRYGVCAIIALLHDVLIVMGLTSILGKFFAFQVDAMFITAVLTVMGYSVHDTIVVFDRIRENVIKYEGASLEQVANVSVLETMGRSINTSLTTIIVLTALLLLGGPTIRTFLVVLLAGFITGTYSSIFIAAQALVVWEKRELGSKLRFWRRQPEMAQA